MFPLGVVNQQTLGSPPPVSDFPVIEDFTHTSTGASTAVSLALTAPTGITSGETLVAICFCDLKGGTGIFSTTETGWIEIGEIGNISSDVYIGVFYKPNASGSEGTFTVDIVSAALLGGWYMRVSGSDPATPINASAFAATGGATTHDMPSVTTTEDNCLVLGALSFDNAGTFSNLTSGWTEEDQDSQTGLSAFLCSKEHEEAGATGNATVTSSVSDGSARCQIAVNGIQQLLKVEDNFTDTDSTLLSAHTSDSGHDWTYFNGVTPDIQSNAVNCKGTCNFLLEPTIADAIVEVDLIQGGNQQATGFYWRSTSAFTNNFALWPDDTQLRFYHSTGNIEVTESNNNSTMSAVVGFKGQEHRIWVNDVHKFTHTDANWTTQRYHGHRFYGGVNVLGVDNLKIHRCIINPTEIDDCILWLDASDRGTTTNQWDDKSGKDYHFTSSVAGEFPTFSGGVATFDGTADHLDGPDISGEFADDVADVFILMKRYADNADAGFNTGWHNFGNSGSIFHFTYSSSVYDGMFCAARHTVGDPDEDVSNYHVYNIISDDTDYQFNQDGVEQFASAASTFFAPTAPVFGKSLSSYYFQGDVKAIVIFSRKLTTVERAQMELYLANL